MTQLVNSAPNAHEFRNLEAPAGYRNINELADLSTQSWLHPVQSLFGDWSGRHLIMGQDFDSWGNLVGRSADKLRHNHNFPTNRHLEKIFGEQLDAVYANLSWFIKEGKNASAPVNFTRKVMIANEPILKATISAMPNLQKIYCLGSKVFTALSLQKYVPLTKCQTVLFDQPVEIYALPHPGNMGMANFQKRTGINREAALNQIQAFVRS